MFLAADNLSAIKTLSHGFFTRNGGVSCGIYESLNCGMGSGDDKGNVITNKLRVAEALGAPADMLCSLFQVHSPDVITVAGKFDNDSKPQGDAMVTNLPQVALGILTADCVPVLFADKKNGIIGAAHSGWKGAVGGVLQNTIEAMIALGAERSSIAAAIGPAISQQSYEVGEDFMKVFTDREYSSRKYFIQSANDGKWLFNLKCFVKDSIADSGISDINMLENDTYIEEDKFFSYRRATHRGEVDYGRQISAIMLRN